MKYYHYYHFNYYLEKINEVIRLGLRSLEEAYSGLGLWLDRVHL